MNISTLRVTARRRCGEGQPYPELPVILNIKWRRFLNVNWRWGTSVLLQGLRGARPVPNWRVSPRRPRVTRQVVENFEPGQLLLSVHMRLWHDGRRLCQAAHIQIDLIRPLVSLVS